MHSNIYDSIINGRIFYDIDTTPGQSGSPVYVSEEKNRLVGIHKGYKSKESLNCATMIT
jgi:V8-like Glu-specific endopeptidase